ncbi:hypothetical protein AB0J25_01645 [Streptomyces sp. NPDC049910]|uniref:hypothetical protein n=1 Tax=Streptomyces sp. NPDC049910 TaxID=3155278 RepID=UPI003444D1D1
MPLEPRLPDGPWKAALTVQSGTVQRTSTATVTLAAEKRTSHALLYAGAAAAAALAAGAVALAVTRRRRRSSGPVATPSG